MNDTVSEIKKKVDIVEFISSFVALKKAGVNFKGLCPFHQEKTPSFVVSPERQIWHCFGGCNDGGDVIKFLMKLENITFFEATRELALKAGIKISKSAFEDEAWKKKERLISLNLLAAEFFNYILFKRDVGKRALDYLSSRSIKKQIAQKFQLGYAPSSWDSLLSFLKKKHFTESELATGGLIIRSDRGSYYDRFRGRLIFPLKDPRGNVIGFSGRSLDPSTPDSRSGQVGAKYINSPETPLYRKRETLFGIDLAKEAIKKEKNVILVEGEFDMISPYQEGIENIVATKGTAVTREQLTLLKRFTPRVSLALDSDLAGAEAVRKTVESAEPLDLEIDVVPIDFAKDPDEAVHKDFPRFKSLLKSKVAVYDFLIDHTRKKYPSDDPYAKKKVGDEILPLIERIQNPIVQSHYVKKLSEILGVSEQSIEFMLRKARFQAKKQFLSAGKEKKEEENREVNIQKYLLSVIFQNKEPQKVSEKVFTIIGPDDFTVPSYGKIAKVFLEEQKIPSGFNAHQFFSELPAELKPVLDQLYLYASIDLGFGDEALEKLAYEVRKFSLKKNISKLLTDDKEHSQELKKLSTMLTEVEKKRTGV